MQVLIFILSLLVLEDFDKSFSSKDPGTFHFGLLNPLSPNIKIHILPTIPLIFLMVLVGRI